MNTFWLGTPSLETLLSHEKHLEDALNKVRAEIRQLKAAAGVNIAGEEDDDGNAAVGESVE